MIPFEEITENGFTFKRSSRGETWRLILSDTNEIKSLFFSSGETKTILNGLEFDAFAEVETYCNENNINILKEENYI